MKAVLDTNIFVSAVFWGGIPEKILDLLSEGKFTLITSHEIIEEITEVLSEFHMPAAEVSTWRKYLVENSNVVKPTTQIAVCADKKDNKFIEAANTARADYLVSGDNHLLILKEYQQTKIITARKFFEILE